MGSDISDYKKRRSNIIQELRKIQLPTDGSATNLCWAIGTALNVTGVTVKNYIQGEVKDGYLAEAILYEFKRLKSKNK